jgi:hypothetical protein
MRLRLCLAILAPLLVAACSARHPAAPVPARFHHPFIITFWCGPPLAEFTDERAAEIAAAGFTVVGAPCEGPIDAEANRRALEVAQRHGLRMWVSDRRIGRHTTASPGWESRVDAAVAAYRSFPAFDGFFVLDEPRAEEFEAIAPVVARLHSADPARLAYINLLPDWAVAKNPRAPAYEEYVDGFIDSVHPRLLSYDYYPFLADGDRPSFFDNLAAMRAEAARHRLPFMLIVQAMPHGSYRDPTEAEISWQVFHALAFGAQGISYFAYWTPVQVACADKMNFHHGLIEHGKPTRHYFEAMRLNRKVAALAAALAGFDSVAVADSTGEMAAPFPIGPIGAIEGGRITAGLFAGGHGTAAVLLVNRDYRHGSTVRLLLRDAAPMPERFDVATGRWAPLTTLTLTFAPGDAELLRWGAAYSLSSVMSSSASSAEPSRNSASKRTSSSGSERAARSTSRLRGSSLSARMSSAAMRTSGLGSFSAPMAASTAARVSDTSARASSAAVRTPAL